MSELVRVYPVATETMRDGSVRAVWRCDICHVRGVRMFSERIAEIAAELMQRGEGVGMIPPEGWAIVHLTVAGAAGRKDGDNVMIDESVMVLCGRCRSLLETLLPSMEETADA